MRRYMVTAVGPDRPGVVAALSGVLVELGCNLSDTQMAVLQGHASMMLVVDAPPTVETKVLHDALLIAGRGLDHDIWVHELADSPAPRPSGRLWLVSLHGADRPGVVYEVTCLLADAGVNIVDLQSRLNGRVASLSMQVDVPTGVIGTEVADRLDRLGEEYGLTCSMRPLPEHG